jgi:methyl-accepting chemotaxis protein
VPWFTSRRTLPAAESCRFFPRRGGLVRTPGVFRLRLQSRALIVFLLASVLPVVIMAVLSYNKARMMLEMEPSTVIQSLLYLTAFLLTITLAMAILLSRTFSSSIVQPIRMMEQAITEVAQGDFAAAVPVNSNLVLASDGVWETRNPEGEIFGKHRICEIVRKQRQASAAEILSVALDELTEFQQHQRKADDVTLVVIKLTA